MAYANRELVIALRATAARLREGAAYRWTHMGACNCGHLAQTLTALPPAEIHRLALERAGDWGEQSVEHCAQSGLPIDHVIATMLEAGLERRDLDALERLSDARVLARFPLGARGLDRRKREDVVRYMEAWADLLEGELACCDDVERSGPRSRAELPPPNPLPRAGGGDARAPADRRSA